MVPIKHRYSGLVAAFNPADSKHTPGQWKAEGWEGVGVNAHDARHPQGFVTILCIAGGSDKAKLEEIKANSRLISRAPTMLTAIHDAIAALTQNATHPADVDAAVSALLDSIKDL
jgi:hypothetical protein